MNNMNEIASGIVDVEMEVKSLELLPPSHELVTRGKVWIALFQLVALLPGSRLILNFMMKKLTLHTCAKKKINPFYAQHPPIGHTEIPHESLER